ncbi:MAG: cyclase family protein [Sphaerochaetaceae bacterium]|nr:cyclase family protein [Sphaerochaetaceae bacterium]
MLIDLSLPIIENHWRYSKFHREEASSFSKGDSWQITQFNMASHWFSHIDFPRHTGAEYPDSECFPLDYYNGEASEIDLTRKEGCSNYGYTSDDLERAVKGQSLKKIFLIRSDWALQTSWLSRDFWDESPYMEDDALQWILDRKPNCVAFDFPQDYSIRLLSKRPVAPEEQKSHTLLLRNNILLVEYVTNFNAIGQDTCEFMCLPLKLENIDGSPVRAVAKI